VRRRSAGLRVRASWGAPVEWQPAKVVSNKKVAELLHVMVVDIGAERAAAYTKPGQYVQVKVRSCSGVCVCVGGGAAG
jgi:NAD(P)H-flavin reductase